MSLFPDFEYTRIFPAIDLRGGRCVRLVEGRRDAEIHYGDDPVAVALDWVEQGAECLHIIDLGAAFGEADSAGVILEIASQVDVPVQTGGGIRDGGAVSRFLDGGVARVLLGTRAFRDPDFLAREVERYGENRVVACLDTRDGQVQISGWEEESGLDLAAGIDLVRGAGVRRLLVTATDRDGTLSGPRIELIERVLAEGDMRVIAAGGIGSLEDVDSLLRLSHPLLEGVVVGRALYEGKVRLADAVERARANIDVISGKKKGCSGILRTLTWFFPD